jgi:hypothetical protein
MKPFPSLKKSSYKKNKSKYLKEKTTNNKQSYKIYNKNSTPFRKSTNSSLRKYKPEKNSFPNSITESLLVKQSLRQWPKTSHSRLRNSTTTGSESTPISLKRSNTG